MRNKTCSCCKLKLPEELYQYTDKTKTARHTVRCIACKRDCTPRTCRLGWTWVGTKPYPTYEAAKAAE